MIFVLQIFHILMLNFEFDQMLYALLLRVEQRFHHLKIKCYYEQNKKKEKHGFAKLMFSGDGLEG